jgi:hypothetical protein
LTSYVKIQDVYNLGSKLVNVQLAAERLRKMVVLPERGLSLSDAVRDVFDERFAGPGAAAPGDVGAMVTPLRESYPDPPDLERR